MACLPAAPQIFGARAFPLASGSLLRRLGSLAFPGAAPHRPSYRAHTPDGRHGVRFVAVDGHHRCRNHQRACSDHTANDSQHDPACRRHNVDIVGPRADRGSIPTKAGPSSAFPHAPGGVDWSCGCRRRRSGYRRPAKRNTIRQGP